MKVNHTEDEIQKVIHTPLFVKRSEDLVWEMQEFKHKKDAFYLCR